MSALMSAIGALSGLVVLTLSFVGHDPRQTFIKSGQVLRLQAGWRLRVNPQDYTPDAICRSLGLGDFQTIWKRGLPMQELKVLLCPSFHPELCLVFWEENGQTQV